MSGNDNNIDKKKLLKSLDKVTTKVAKKIKKSKNKDFILVKKDREKIKIADYMVEKDESGDFMVVRHDKVLWSHIALFDIATSLINSRMARNENHTKTLVSINKDYIRLTNELAFYEHSLKSKTNGDRCIVMSRIDLTRLKLEEVLDNLYRFKITI